MASRLNSDSGRTVCNLLDFQIVRESFSVESLEEWILRRSQVLGMLFGVI